MTKLRIVLFAAALGLAVGTASAEPPTGSRLGDATLRGPKLTPKDQAVGAKRLAKCLYDRETPVARRVLLARNAQEENGLSNKLMGQLQCFNMQFSNDLVGERHVHYPHDILRGMLAEVAIERSKEQAAALQPVPLQQVYQRDWFVVTGRHVSVDEMGACIADVNPSGVAALISTEPMGKDEGVAFAGLSGDLGKCLRAGTRLQASRQALRAALADALFQRIYAPATAPAAAPAAGVSKQ